VAPTQALAPRANRITDDQLVSILTSQPSISAGAVDQFHFEGLRDLERSCPNSYALVHARMSARIGESKFAGLYAADARIVRVMAFNAAVGARLDEFQTYYRQSKQNAAADYVGKLMSDYEWTYTDLAGLYADQGDFGLQLREVLAMGQPDELVAKLVKDADEAQAEQIRREQIAAAAAKWIGLLVAAQENIFSSDTQIALKELLFPDYGTDTYDEAMARARISGDSCAVVMISGRWHIFSLDEQFDHSDVFLVQQFEEARTEIVPVATTPAGMVLTTSDGYVIKRDGERFFGGALARDPQAHLAADEALLESSGSDLDGDQAVRLFKQLTLDLLLTNLGAAEQRARDQLATIYGTSWNWIDTTKGLYPKTWQRVLHPRTGVGADIQSAAANLRANMIAAADFTASVGDRELTEDEHTEIEYTLEEIGRTYAEEPIAAMMVINHRDADAKGPADADDFEDQTAGLADNDVAGLASKQLFERLDNIETVRRHFFRHPDAVLELEPLHAQIIDGFSATQRFWIEMAIGTHGLRELAATLGIAVLQLGLVITGMFTAGLTSLAAFGGSTLLGAAGTASAFENSRLLSAMSNLDARGGFQLATPDQAASARRWAYIGLALTMLDVGGFVMTARLAARLSRAALMPDVAAILRTGEGDLTKIAKQLNMSERTLARELETLTGAERASLLERIRGAMGLEIVGAAHTPGVTWLPNPGGEIRTLDQAIAIARRHGVEIADDIAFEVVPQAALPRGARAAYLQLGSNRVRRLAGDFVEWDDFYNAVNDMIPVRLSNEILASDEEIVAVIAHEMHEIEGLRALFEANDLRMTAAELHRLITPGYKGNLHYQAWDIADKLVLAMRKAHP
jgi:hypothetical protein